MFLSGGRRPIAVTSSSNCVVLWIVCPVNRKITTLYCSQLVSNLNSHKRSFASQSKLFRKQVEAIKWHGNVINNSQKKKRHLKLKMKLIKPDICLRYTDLHWMHMKVYTCHFHWGLHSVYTRSFNIGPRGKRFLYQADARSSSHRINTID